MALPCYTAECPYRAGDLVVIVRARVKGALLEPGSCVPVHPWDVSEYLNWAYEVRRAEPHEEAAWRLREKQ